MKKIMILGASILQLPAIQKAKQMGIYTIVIDQNPEAIGLAYADAFELISTIDTEQVLERAKKYNIDGIMTLASDMPMRTVAKVSQELGLVGITEDTAIKATNKVEMRKCLQEHQVPIPQFYSAFDKKEFMHAIENFKEVCIVKPADNAGSRGVSLVKNTRDHKELEYAYTYSKCNARSDEIIIEEYMDGPEVSVETLSVDGTCHVIQITDKLITGAPYFVELGHSQPSQYSEKIKEQISKVAIAAVNAIGIVNGPSHTEIKITGEGPKVVELGARLGGDNITTHLVPLSTGIDMVECCINISLGLELNMDIKFDRGSAIRYFQIEPGRVLGIEGMEEARFIEGVKQISLSKKIGEIAVPIKNSLDRFGFVISHGKTAEDAVGICNQVLDTIEFKMEEVCDE